MDRVLRRDERLRRMPKPGLQRMGQAALRVDDTFVVCAGFEWRAVTVLRRAVEEGCTGFRAVVIEYLPFMPQNRLRQIQKLCKRAEADIVPLQYDRREPRGEGEALVAAVGDRGGRVVLDVSGMSRLLIVQALTGLAQAGAGLGQLWVAYTEARDYPPSQSDVESALSSRSKGTIYDTMFLSAGVHEVAILPELSSVNLQGQPVRLVAFPSFNPHQLTALRTEVQPSYVTLVHGVPHLPKDRWRLEAIRQLNRTDQIPRREDLRASTLDYRETLDILLDVYAQRGATERIIVSPTGSKMQAVAVGLFRHFVEDVQVVYPTPREFTSPQHYTHGSRAVYCLPLREFLAVSR